MKNTLLSMVIFGIVLFTHLNTRASISEIYIYEPTLQPESKDPRVAIFAIAGLIVTGIGGYIIKKGVDVLYTKHETLEPHTKRTPQWLEPVLDKLYGISASLAGGLLTLVGLSIILESKELISEHDLENTRYRSPGW